MKKIVLSSLFCVVSLALYAQHPSPPSRPAPPADPLLNKAPDFAQWTITSKVVTASPAVSPIPSPTAKPKTGRSSRLPGGRDPKKQADPVDQKTTVVKTQSIRHEETIPVSGDKVERWCVPDMQITINGSSAPVIALPGKADEYDYTDYSITDFLGFDWISKRNFVGTEKVLGQDCFVFRQEIKGENADPNAPAIQEAAINTATRLPVRLQLEGEVRIYEFGLAPVTMLVVPPAVESAMERWRKSMSQSALMPGKP